MCGFPGHRAGKSGVGGAVVSSARLNMALQASSFKFHDEEGRLERMYLDLPESITRMRGHWPQAMI